MWKSDRISWCNRLQRTRPLRAAPMTSNKRKHSSQDPRHTISDKESSPRLTQRIELSPLRRRVRTKCKVFSFAEGAKRRRMKNKWKNEERSSEKELRVRISSGYFSFDGNTREGVILKRFSRFFLEWTILFSEIFFYLLPLRRTVDERLQNRGGGKLTLEFPFTSYRLFIVLSLFILYFVHLFAGHFWRVSFIDFIVSLLGFFDLFHFVIYSISFFRKL